MKIAIIGAGALGTFYSAMIASSGQDTTLICREQDVFKLRNGIQVTDALQLNAHPHISSTLQQADVVFITVKAYDIASAVRDLPLNTHTLVVIIHNGLGGDEIASGLLGQQHVGVGVSYSGVVLLESGKVKLNGYTETVLGSVDSDAQQCMGKALKILQDAGLRARITDDIRTAQWEKMYTNVGINAITAITGFHNGALLEIPSLQEVVIDAVTEAYKVSQAMGIKTQKSPVENTFKVIKNTASNLSSMLQDILKGKRTEIDVLNGKISEFGRKMNIPTPVNDTLTRLVKGIEQRPLSKTLL